MTIEHAPTALAALTAVAPMIDYEPPARAVAHRRAPGRSASVRRRRARPPAPRPPGAARPALPPALQSAAAFADAALRRVLEVIDRRRPISQLRPLLTPELAASVLSARPASESGAMSMAVLQRVRVQVVAGGDPPTAVEAFGTYRRGRRVHALACRIERMAGDVEPGWRVSALHIG